MERQISGENSGGNLTHPRTLAKRIVTLHTSDFTVDLGDDGDPIVPVVDGGAVGVDEGDVDHARGNGEDWPPPTCLRTQWCSICLALHFYALFGCGSSLEYLGIFKARFWADRSSRSILEVVYARVILRPLTYFPMMVCETFQNSWFVRSRPVAVL